MTDTMNPSGGAPKTPSSSQEAPAAPTAPQAPVAPTAPQPPVAPQQPAAAAQPAGAQPAAAQAAAGAAPQQPFAAPGAQVPPAGAVPPMGAAPQYQAAPKPQNLPGMPLLYLTGGMKFGWAALGFIMGPVAILIAWLTNASNFPDAKRDALKFSLFGFLAQFLIAAMLMGLVGCFSCAAIGSSGYCYY